MLRLVIMGLRTRSVFMVNLHKFYIIGHPLTPGVDLKVIHA